MTYGDQGVDGEVRYHPDADQQALAGAFGETIAALLPIARLREARAETGATVGALQEAGLFTIAVDEVFGGSALSAAEEALIVLVLGRHLVSPDVVATIGALPAIAAVRGASDTAPRVAAGYRRAGRTVLIDGHDADLVLVRDGALATVHELATRGAVIDGRSWLSELRETELGAEVCAIGNHDLLRLRLIDAAVLAGLADGALAMAVDYAGMREQFGRPIGSFQAVKHHAANMAIAARCARDQVSYAAVALDQGREDMALLVEAAFLVSARAAINNAGLNIQIHGGMGFSEEADPHLFLKRAQTYVAIAGGVEAAIDRVADIAPMVANG